jgi:hypothetical protein
MNKKPSHRADRLRLHGPRPLQRLPQGRQLLRLRVPAVLRPSARATRKSSRPSPRAGATSRSRRTGSKLIARDDIDAIDIARPTTSHAEIAIAAAKAGKMILCEKPLAMNPPEAEKMVAAVEKAKVPNMVWYNYRRVPGRHARQAAHRRGQARPRSSTTAPTSSRTGRSTPICRRAAPASGASTSRRRRQRRHRRPARPLHRHRDVAQRRHRRRHRDDGDVRQGAEAQPHRQGREGRHRRRLRLPRHFNNGSLGTLRVHPLRPRPQGALHLRDQRRARLDQVGPARPAPPPVVRPQATRQRSAAGARSTSPTATIRT